MWDSVAPWLAQGGLGVALAWLGYRLHKDAVDAHRQRAEAAERRAEAAEKRADVREEQISILLGRRESP